MFFSFHFVIGKTYLFEHRNLSKILFCHVLLDFEKRLKIDSFERGISEHFPIAYELISKTLTFSYAFFNFYVFIVVQDLGPGPPPSKLGFR